MFGRSRTAAVKGQAAAASEFGARLARDRKFRVRLSLGYQAEAFVEAVGPAAGLDRRRIEGDLVRSSELIEGRGTEGGAWRADISAGTTT